MARLERAVLLLLCIFAVKFVFSTAAHFAVLLQVVDMFGSGRNPVDVWLLLLCCTAVLGTFCLYRRAARAIGAKCTKADAVILAVCIAASAAFYLHAMVGRQSLYLWDNATYYNLQVRLESNFADGVFTGVDMFAERPSTGRPARSYPYRSSAFFAASTGSPSI